jgi:N-acetylmuramic acid 6-phosphate (MurNAc-6-P) etherase
MDEQRGRPPEDDPILMASANHLLMVFLAIEMASVPSFVLAGMLKGRRQSSEAALKYSIYGAGTATKMVLNMFSTATMVQLGRTYGSLMVDMRATNAKLRHRAIRIVAEATGADAATAAAALDAAGWHAKPAIATILTGLSPAEASRALDRAGGRLRTVLEERG